jgi:hypothetical protein
MGFQKTFYSRTENIKRQSLKYQFNKGIIPPMNKPQIKQHDSMVLTQEVSNSLNNWIYERVKPYISGRALEIANYEGSIASICKHEGIDIEVMSMNLADDLFDTSNSLLFRVFDSIAVFQESKQIVYNENIVANINKLLKQRGYLLIQIPARTALYNGLEQGLEDWKLYNWQYINRVIGNGYDLLEVRCFIVSENMNPIIQKASKYLKRVTVFSSNNASAYIQAGLSMLIVCRKR